MGKPNNPAIVGLVSLVFTVVVTVLVSTAVNPDRDEAEERDNAPFQSVVFPDRQVLASGSALESAEVAEEAALAEIPAGIDTSNPVVRLITGIDVGQFLDTCLPWQNERPFWLVGIETDAQPDWFGTGHSPSSASIIGVYIVLDANDGELRAFGSLDSDGYDDIVSMSNDSLSIAYETSLPASAGVATDQAGPSATQILATRVAIPTSEAACRDNHW
jgi:hypothetical protein